MLSVLIQLFLPMSNKAKIVVDADVVIHFIKGESLHILPHIFPNYKLVIIEELLNKELRNIQSTRTYLDNFFNYFPHLILKVKWNPNYEMLKELARLTSKFGYGESISLVYCKFNHDVIASSNIKDITDYCEENDIQYITTMDFLWQAKVSGLMSEEDCNKFIKNVKDKKSALPVDSIDEYKPRSILI